MEQREFRELIDFMRERGVSSFSIGDIEVRFEQPTSKVPIPGSAVPLDMLVTDGQEKDDDELMYYSAD